MRTTRISARRSIAAIGPDHRRHRGHRVAVVCHGGVINALPAPHPRSRPGSAAGSSTRTTPPSTVWLRRRVANGRSSPSTRPPTSAAAGSPWVCSRKADDDLSRRDRPDRLPRSFTRHRGTAVESTIARLDGFTALEERDEWTDIPTRGYVVRDGAIIAWSIPDGASAGDRVSDRRRPHRLTVPARQAATRHRRCRVETARRRGLRRHPEQHVARPRSRHRRSGRDAGRRRNVLVDVAEPIARVPQLAVHLDRGVNNDGLTLDRQHHLTPVWGVGVSSPGEFASWIGERAGLDAPPAWWDLCLYDTPGCGDHRRRPITADVGPPRQPTVVLGCGSARWRRAPRPNTSRSSC